MLTIGAVIGAVEARSQYVVALALCFNTIIQALNIGGNAESIGTSGQRGCKEYGGGRSAHFHLRYRVQTVTLDVVDLAWC